MRRSKADSIREYKTAAKEPGHNQGLISGHGIMLQNELCLIPPGIFLRPVTPSLCSAIEEDFLKDREDRFNYWKTNSRKNLRAFETEQGSYQSVYPEGSLVPNLLVQFQGYLFNEGVINATRDFLKTERQAPEKNTERIDALEYILNFFTTYPTWVFYAGVITGDIVPENKDTPLIKFYNTQELTRLKRKVVEGGRLSPKEVNIMQARLSICRELCSKFNNSDIVKYNENIRLSVVLKRISQYGGDLPQVFILSTCRDGEWKESPDTHACHQLGIQVLDDVQQNVATRKGSFDDSPEFFNFMQTLTDVTNDIKSDRSVIVQRMIAADMQLRCEEEKFLELDRLKVTPKCVKNYLSEVLGRVHETIAYENYITYKSFCFVQYLENFFGGTGSDKALFEEGKEEYEKFKLKICQFTELPVGSEVEVVNLTSHPEFNNKRGKIMKPVEDTTGSKRYKVSLYGETPKSLSVLAENLIIF